MGGGAGLHSRSWAAEARARATGRGDARGRLLRLTCAQYVVHMYDSEVLYRGLYRSRTGSVLIRFNGCARASPSALNENEVPDADTDGETGIGLDRHG